MAESSSWVTVEKSTPSPLTTLRASLTSVKTTLSPLSISAVRAGLVRSCASSFTPARSSACSTVSAETHWVVGFLPARLKVMRLEVTSSRSTPSRPMPSPRLVERRAPSAGTPISTSAEATSVAVTQWVVVSPSTVRSTGRP